MTAAMLPKRPSKSTFFNCRRRKQNQHEELQIIQGQMILIERLAIKLPKTYTNERIHHNKRWTPQNQTLILSISLNRAPVSSAAARWSPPRTSANLWCSLAPSGVALRSPWNASPTSSALDPQSRCQPKGRSPTWGRSPGVWVGRTRASSLSGRDRMEKRKRDFIAAFQRCCSVIVQRKTTITICRYFHWIEVISA